MQTHINSDGTYTVHVRTRHGAFVTVRMPEFTSYGVRRTAVRYEFQYATGSGTVSLSRWCLENGRLETYGDMLDDMRLARVAA